MVAQLAHPSIIVGGRDGTAMDDDDTCYEKLLDLIKRDRGRPFFMTDKGRQELAYCYARESGYFDMEGEVRGKRELDIACHHSMSTVLEFNNILVEKFGQDIADSVVREYIERNC
jgi:hypothetical protein